MIELHPLKVPQEFTYVLDNLCIAVLQSPQFAVFEILLTGFYRRCSSARKTFFLGSL
jgi:hypothetical protein